MKTLLLIIDMQNDFCDSRGALYVPGADQDVHRLSRLLRERRAEIDQVILTQDNHQVMDIAHPVFWRDASGKPPQPFTQITSAEVITGIWTPLQHRNEVVRYLQKSEENGEYIHTIWPEHCILGSEGAAIIPALMDELVSWARQGKYFHLVSKGTHPLTEHFGALRANVPREDAPETVLNRGLLEALDSSDIIWLAGEARSHCVAQTVYQLFDFPQILRKLVILEDCMSPVTGCERLAVPVFREAEMKGVSFTTSACLISDF